MKEDKHIKKWWHSICMTRRKKRMHQHLVTPLPHLVAAENHGSAGVAALPRSEPSSKLAYIPKNGQEISRNILYLTRFS